MGTTSTTGNFGPQLSSELFAALAACRGALIGVGLFSILINVLMLTGSLYMLEVYDRVLPSRSVPTLVGLSILTATLFLFQAVLDLTRGRLLVRLGNHLDSALGPRIYDLIVRLPLRSRQGSDSVQLVRDLDTIRSFLSGSGPTAFFDLPWLPFYLAICFAFHVWIGVTALGGSARARSPHAVDRDHVAQASSFGQHVCRGAHAVCRNQPQKCRGADGHGNIGPAS